MHASLAFLNGAGARRNTARAPNNAFFEVLQLLCTTRLLTTRRVAAARVRSESGTSRPARPSHPARQHTIE
jgi:hypothetical protein